MVARMQCHLQPAGWQVILGGVLLHLCFGTLYLWGNISVYVTSYLRQYDETVTSADTLVVYGTTMLSQACTMILGGYIQLWLGARQTAIISGFILATGVAMSSLASTVLALTCTYGAMFGISIALGYACPLVVGYQWMPHSRGAVSGFIVAGFGGGASLFDVIATHYVNPDNLEANLCDSGGCYFGEEVAERVPGMLRMLATCYLVLTVAGAMLLRLPPGVWGAGQEHCADDVPPKLQLWGDAGGADHTPGGSACIRQSPRKGDKAGAYGFLPSQSPPEAVVVEEGQASPRLRSPRPRPQGEEHPGWDSNVKYQSLGTTSSVHEKELCLVGGNVGEQSSINNEGSLQYGADDQGGLQWPGGVLELQGRKPGSSRACEVPTGEMVRTWVAWHLVACFVLTSVSGLYVAGTYKEFGRELFSDDKFLMRVGMAASICNAIGRVFWGMAADRIGLFRAMAAVATGLLLLLCTYERAAQDKRLFSIWTCAILWCYGGNFAVYPATVAHLYGPKHAGPNYGVLFTCFGVSSFFILRYLSHLTGHAVLSWMGTIAAVGLVLTLSLWFRIAFFGRQEERSEE